MLISHRTTLPDPFYYRIPNAPLSLVFFRYGTALDTADAIEAVEKAWIEATIRETRSTDPVGTSPRTYIHDSAIFYIEPQARLNWKTYQAVTFGIMGVLGKIVHKETDFTILGDRYEGSLGNGSVINIA